MSEPALAMAVAGMVERLPAMRALQPPLTEADTCGGIIEPILRAIGWDLDDVLSVRRQYRHGKGGNPVDYGLFLDGVPVLFVEAKSLAGDLDDGRWRNQTLSYAYLAGVGWCVLSNGQEWRLYKTMAEGEAADRLLKTVRLTDADAVRQLALISPKAVQEDEAERLWNAERAERLVRPALLTVMASPEFARLVQRQIPEKLSLDAVREALGRIGVPTASPAEVPPPAPVPSIITEPVLQVPVPELGGTTLRSRQRQETMADLLADGRLRIGETVTIQGYAQSDAQVVDSKTVRFNGTVMTWNDWGCRVTGWSSINIYLHATLPDGRILAALRRQRV